jgi:hypothetical protein
MAATSWTFYNSFREYLGKGSFDLANVAVNFNLSLHTHLASVNVNNVALSTQASILNEVANGNGYTTGGKALANRTWASVATNKFRFDSDSVIFTATGGDLTDIKYAVIYQSGGKLVCFSKLTASQFTLTDTTTLTIEPNTGGIFELI